MMKAIKYSIILGLVLMVTASSHASEVNNVELSYKDGHTLARIAIDGPVRYTHQSEIAKDGKPFRVIVDVLSATHELGAKKFTRLPNCAITSLRTSQFAVNPEKVVRIVFDMKKETVYKVLSDQTSVTVSFPDKGSVSFASWSTIKVVKALNSVTSSGQKVAKVDISSKPIAVVKSPSKTVKDVNNSIEKDRQQSLASKPSKPTPPTVAKKAVVASKSVSKPVVKPAAELAVSSKHLGPEVVETSPQKAERIDSKDIVAKKTSFASNLNYSPAPQQKALASSVEKKSNSQSEPKVSTNSKPVTPVDPVKAVKKSAVTKPAPSKAKPVKQTPPAFENKKPVMAKVSPSEKPTAKPKATVKPTVKKQTSKSTAVKSAKTESKPKSVAKAEKPKKAAKKVTVASKDDNSKAKPTSRFRRSGKNRKIQGTMVAEFPKRLVIKYHSKARRDPFETLVNEKKVSNSPTAKRIPNVEGLKLVGVIEADNAKNQALFEDKQGYGYILKSGDKVRKGYVLRVEADRVYFQIFEYGWSRTIALNLDDN